VSYHYDRSNDFYALWLDRRMVYSCAYFGDEQMDLERAQERKLDYCCRKLRLQPGERLLDIGCEWGALVLHAVQHYAVEALGITLSAAQVEYANDRIREAGLQARCRVELLDYREVEADHPFDKVVSVGMVEHIGRANLTAYFDQARRLLMPGGVFLNHGIATPVSHAALTPKHRSFVGTYVFPDGELVPIHEMLHTAEAVGFETRDVESLR
jgi:cyclopropane-fatty-acyl-phospholipid synthase